jgi:hypothetical protein
MNRKQFERVQQLISLLDALGEYKNEYVGISKPYTRNVAAAEYYDRIGAKIIPATRAMYCAELNIAKADVLQELKSLGVELEEK